MAKHSFLGHAAVYALGEFLLLAGGFVLLPLYTRRLDGSAFGALEVLERFSDVLAIGLLTRGIPLATLVFYKQARDDAERREVVWAAWLLALAGVGFGCAVVLPLAGPLGDLLGLDRAALLQVAVVANLLDSAAVVAMAVLQARVESGRYVAVAGVQLLLKVALGVYFVVGLGWGIWGIVVASLLRAGVVAGCLVVRELRRGFRLPRAALVYDMLRFVLPFVPVGLCAFVLNSGDRFFLLGHGGPAAVGVYGLGYRLAILAGLFSLTPLYRVWSVRLHDAAAAPDAPAVFGRTATQLLAAYTFLGLGLCLFADEAVWFLAGTGYAAAVPVVAPTVFAYWFSGAAVLADAPFYLRRRGGLKLAVTLASTAVMLALYTLLIPAHGCLGASLATVGGFVCQAVLTWAVAQHVFPVRYEFARLGALLLTAAVCWGVSLLLPASAWAIPVKAALWVAWPALLWATGLVSPAEKQAARAVVGDAVAGLGRLTLRARRVPRSPAGAMTEPGTSPPAEEKPCPLPSPS